MSRVKDNKTMAQWVLEQTGQSMTFQEGMINNMNILNSILLDISQSLAVIADRMSGEETE